MTCFSPGKTHFATSSLRLSTIAESNVWDVYISDTLLQNLATDWPLLDTMGKHRCGTDDVVWPCGFGVFFLLWVWSKRVRDALDAFCYFASLFQCATDQCGSGVSLCSGALGKPAWKCVRGNSILQQSFYIWFVLWSFQEDPLRYHKLGRGISSRYRGDEVSVA